jgi:hypothetical protein
MAVVQQTQDVMEDLWREMWCMDPGLHDMIAAASRVRCCAVLVRAQDVGVGSRSAKFLSATQPKPTFLPLTSKAVERSAFTVRLPLAGHAGKFLRRAHWQVRQ